MLIGIVAVAVRSSVLHGRIVQAGREFAAAMVGVIGAKFCASKTKRGVKVSRDKAHSAKQVLRKTTG